VSASPSHELHVAVLGAGGTIAPAIVRDLAESEEVAEMTLLDLDPRRAEAVADRDAGGRANALAVDATDVGALSNALDDVDVLVNSASYRVNLDAMGACLQARTHYLDLGGLYWVTQRQLGMSDEFERAGLLAVLGIGSSPGKTNLMAARAVRELDGPPETIEIAAAGRDFGLTDDDGRLRPPYAIQTLLDELTMEPVVIRDAEVTRIAPLSDGGEVDYGPPIGPAHTIFTLHSELATFADSFGCENSSFRLSLAAPLLERLRALIGAEPDEVALAAREAAQPSSHTVSVHLVTVTGREGEVIRARAVSEPHFGRGGSVVSTAAPAAAAVRLLARGSLSATGALPPERCIDPEEMFAELELRSCEVGLG
jgi:saccharopine dehydrogenase-like NADP-dependent oxidoreductase